MCLKSALIYHVSQQSLCPSCSIKDQSDLQLKVCEETTDLNVGLLNTDHAELGMNESSLPAGGAAHGLGAEQAVVWPAGVSGRTKLRTGNRKTWLGTD